VTQETGCDGIADNQESEEGEEARRRDPVADGERPRHGKERNETKASVQ
jgi:hypothetical protein